MAYLSGTNILQKKTSHKWHQQWSKLVVVNLKNKWIWKCIALYNLHPHPNILQIFPIRQKATYIKFWPIHFFRYLAQINWSPLTFRIWWSKWNSVSKVYKNCCLIEIFWKNYQFVKGLSRKKGQCIHIFLLQRKVNGSTVQ